MTNFKQADQEITDWAAPHEIGNTDSELSVVDKRW